MLIRKASRTDAKTVWNIRNLAIKAQCSTYYSEDIIEKWTSGEPPEDFDDIVNGDFWVTEIGNEIIGIGKIDLEKAKVDAVFVHPEKMRLGAGVKMIKHLEQLALDHGLTEITLQSTLNAAPFYRSCGFQGNKIVQYHSPRGIILDCIIMLKKIR